MASLQSQRGQPGIAGNIVTRKHFGIGDPRESLVWNLKIVKEIEKKLSQVNRRAEQEKNTAENREATLVREINPIAAQKLLALVDALSKERAKEASFKGNIGRWVAFKDVNPKKVMDEVRKYNDALKEIAISSTAKWEVKSNKYNKELLTVMISAGAMRRDSFGAYLDKKTGALLIAGRVPGILMGAISLTGYPVVIKVTPSMRKLGQVNLIVAYTGSDDSSVPPQALALLVRSYPEIAAYIKAVRSGDLNLYDKYVEEYREKYETALTSIFTEIREKMKKASSEFSSPLDVFTSKEKSIYSNIASNIIGQISSAIGEVHTVSLGSAIVDVHSAIQSLVRFVRVVKEQEEAGGDKYEEELRRLIEEVSPVIDRLHEVGSILNGLQGSRSTTLFTLALLAGLIHSSDLTEDPVIVSAIGDPGTGKTLAVTTLGRLVGITSIIVERQVSKQSVTREIEEEIRRQVESLTGKLTVILSKRTGKPVSDIEDLILDVASGFMEELPRMAVRGVDREKALRLAKKTAKLIGGSLNVEDVRLVKSIYEYLAEIVRIAYEEGEKKEAEYKLRALSIRRELLEELEKLRVIDSAEEKEKNNGGSVEWIVEEREDGYTVKVRIDLHYLLSRFKENALSIINELLKAGNVYLERSQAGVATVKISQSLSVDKLITEKEEDPLSPSARLITTAGPFRRVGVILLDEARRSTLMLENLLTDLSQSALDMRRANLIVTTDNDEPLKETDSDPRLDPLISRVNMMVPTPSTSLYTVRSEAIDKVKKMDVTGQLPIISLDELFPVKLIADYIKVPEVMEEYAEALPLLLSYKIYVFPAVAEDTTEPVILLAPKDEELEISGYQEVKFTGDIVNQEILRPIRERRSPRYTIRIAQVLALLNKKPVVGPEEFANAVTLVLTSRIVPISVESPAKYTEAKIIIARTISEQIKASLESVLNNKGDVVKGFIEEMMKENIDINEAYDLFLEVIKIIRVSPVEAARFIALVERALLSEKRDVFLRNIVKIPSMKSFVERLMVIERLF